MRSSPAAPRSTPILGIRTIRFLEVVSGADSQHSNLRRSSLFALVAPWITPGASERLPDGSPANSGTEYEITHALASQKERNGLPELHVWINQTIPSFQPEPPEVHDERIAQRRALKRFVEHWSKDSEDGSFVGSFTAYHTITEFQDLFEIKLRKIAERRLAVSPGTLAPPAKPVWTEGSPFRGLEPFDFEHRPDSTPVRARRAIRLQRTIVPGANDRFTLQIASEVSTYQQFRIRLTTVDGRQIISPLCRMHFLVPRKFSRKEGYVIEDRQQPV
jgi:hypothetical protein